MNTLAVIGGDARITETVRKIEKSGVKVCTFALDEGTYRAASLEEAVNFSKNILLPLPVSVDGVHVYSQYGSRVALRELLSCDISEKTVIGGKIGDKLRCELSKKGAIVSDILDNETFAVLNAVPTAEGAIAVAIENTSFTIHSSCVLISGFGRIGKVLAGILGAMGADVTVSARKASDIAWARNMGFSTVQTREIADDERTENYDIIFNTVPSLVFPERALKKLKDGVLIIDLASNPGGVDFECAQKNGIRTIHEVSLPVKYSPLTAAECFASAVLSVIRGECE